MSIKISKILWILISLVAFMPPVFGKINKEIKLGSGFLTSSGKHRYQCVDGDYVLSQGSSQVNYKMHESASDLLMKSDIVGTSYVNFLLFKGYASAGATKLLRRKRSVKEHIYSHEFVSSVRTLSSVELSDIGKKYTSKHYKPSLRKFMCGDQFVNSIKYGGKIAFKAFLDFKLKEAVNNFNLSVTVEIDLKFKTIRITYSKNINHRIKRSEINVGIQGVQIGGDRKRFEEILSQVNRDMNSKAMKCENAGIQEVCTIDITQELTKMMNYITYEFPEEVRKNKSVYNYSLTSYNKSPINELKYEIEEENSIEKIANKKAWKNLYIKYNSIHDLYIETNRFFEKNKKNNLYLNYQVESAKSIVDKVKNNLSIVRVALKKCEKNFRVCQDKYREVLSINTFLRAEEHNKLLPEKNIYYYCQMHDKLANSSNKKDKLEKEKLLLVEKLVSNIYGKIDKFSYSYKGCISLQNNLNRLTTLDLSSKSFSENKLTTFAPLIYYPRLRSLNLAYNKIDDISYINKFKNLVELDLKGNNINNAKIELEKLRFLDLSFNSLVTKMIFGKRFKLQSHSVFRFSMIRPREKDESGDNHSDGLTSIVESFIKGAKGASSLNLTTTLNLTLTSYKKGQSEKLEKVINVELDNRTICNDINRLATLKYGLNIEDNDKVYLFVDGIDKPRVFESCDKFAEFNHHENTVSSVDDGTENREDWNKLNDIYNIIEDFYMQVSRLYNDNLVLGLYPTSKIDSAKKIIDKIKLDFDNVRSARNKCIKNLDDCKEMLGKVANTKLKLSDVEKKTLEPLKNLYYYCRKYMDMKNEFGSELQKDKENLLLLDKVINELHEGEEIFSYSKDDCLDLDSRLKDEISLNLSAKSNEDIKLKTFEPLKYYTDLRVLYLAYNNINDVSYINEFKHLKVIDLKGNDIDKIDIDLPNISTLNLSFNRLSRGVSFGHNFKINPYSSYRFSMIIPYEKQLDEGDIVSGTKEIENVFLDAPDNVMLNLSLSRYNKGDNAELEKSVNLNLDKSSLCTELNELAEVKYGQKIDDDGKVHLFTYENGRPIVFNSCEEFSKFNHSDLIKLLGHWSKFSDIYNNLKDSLENMTSHFDQNIALNTYPVNRISRAKKVIKTKKDLFKKVENSYFECVDNLSLCEIKVKESLQVNIELSPQDVLDLEPEENLSYYCSKYYSIKSTQSNNDNEGNELEKERNNIDLLDRVIEALYGKKATFLYSDNECGFMQQRLLSRNSLDLSGKFYKGRKLKTFELLKYYTNIRRIDLAYNEIEDVSYLNTFNHLNKINLKGNSIAKIDVDLESLINLDLSFNPLVDGVTFGDRFNVIPDGVYNFSMISPNGIDGLSDIETTFSAKPENAKLNLSLTRYRKGSNQQLEGNVELNLKNQSVCSDLKELAKFKYRYQTKDKDEIKIFAYNGKVVKSFKSCEELIDYDHSELVSLIAANMEVGE